RKIVDGIFARHGAEAKAGDLREDEPHPVATLAAGAQFRADLIEDRILGFDEAIERVRGHDLSGSSQDTCSCILSQSWSRYSGNCPSCPRFSNQDVAASFPQEMTGGCRLSAVLLPLVPRICLTDS